MKKKILLSIMLCLLTICAFGFLTVSATELIDSGTCGENITWSLDDAGTLIIDGNGIMTNYNNSTTPAPWYTKRDNIVKVVINDGVTNIGKYAFYGCNKLTDVTIPNSVTNLEYAAFWDCYNLKTILIPGSIVNLSDGVFGNCYFENVFYGGTEDQWSSLNIENSYLRSRKTYYNVATIEKIDGINYVVGSDYAVLLKADAGMSGDVSIPNHINSIPIVEIGNQAFYEATNIESITIPDSVTIIGDYAFYNCSGLLNITLPDSLISIGSGAFSKCTSLTSITFPDSVTTIGSYAFLDCYALTDVHITNLTSWCNINFGSIYKNPLYYAENLYLNGTLIEGHLEIPEGVTSIKSCAFTYYHKINSITIPDSVTSIGYEAFRGCFYIKQVRIGAGVKFIDERAFSGVSDIGVVFYAGTLEQWNEIEFVDTILKNASTIYYNFVSEKKIDGITYIVGKNYAILLKAEVDISGNVVIPDTIDNAPVTQIYEDAFYNCTGLTSIIIPDNVTNIGTDAFYSCTNLTSITIPNNITSIGYNAFYNCINLESIYMSNLETYLNCEYGSGISNPMYYATKLYVNGKRAVNIVIPDNVTRIPNYAFYKIDSIKKVVIPNSVTDIGYDAFSNCKELVGVYITDIEAWCNINFSNYTSNPLSCAKNLYLNNILLTNLELPSGVSKIKTYAFYNCNSVTSVFIPESITYIGSYAFNGCSGLENVYVSNVEKWCSIEFADSSANPMSYAENLYFNNKLVTEVEIPYNLTNIKPYAFFSCERITSVSISENITNIGEYAFYGCVNLESVNIPGSITNIGEKVFNRCYNLTTVKLGIGMKKLGKSMFMECSKITKISLPDTIESIGESAFKYCSSLNEIIIPESVIEVEKDAFNYCSKLSLVYYNGTQDEWNEIYIGSNNIYLNNATKNFFFYVSLIDVDGKEISRKMYDTNTLVDTSDIEEKVENTIHLYTDEEGINEYDLTTPISENLTLYLHYVPNQYLSKFINYNGDLLWEGLINYDTVIIPPENPARERTQQYTYTFTGWDGFAEGLTQANREMIFTATYDAILNQYTYKFIDENGDILKEETVDYGTVIEIPDDPNKENTAQYTYTFADWDGYTPGMTLEGDITFNATYTETVNQYTYKFLDDNGDVLKEETVDYGTVIVTPDNPTDKDAYTFDYWEGFVDGMTVAGDITFKAVYKYKMYNVSVFGYEDLKSEVIYNRNYTITPAEKYGYEFLGYYSAENGNGMKLTDENGNSSEVYNVEDDSVIYPYFKDLLCNKVVVSGTDTVTVGDADVRYTVSLGTDKEDIYYTTIMVKYPKAFILEDVIKNKFDETQIVEITEHDDYNVAEILCIYSYDGNVIPTLTPIDAFEVCFNVDKTSKVHDVTVEITNGSILMGETEDYPFDTLVNASISIQPKLAESITIDGFSQIDAPTQYTATVYPDYTTDKTVVWSVSDETVATISEDGVLTPVKNGAVTITATANDGSEVFATKTVDVIAYAQITSISTNGTWIEEFKNGKRNYTIYVGADVTTFDISARYSKGTLRVNGSTLLSGRSKSETLTDTVTTITVERLNVDEMTNITYTLTVIKISDALITESKTTENGYEFNIVLNKDNIESFETAKLVVALYDSSGKFIGLSPVDVNGSDTKKVVPIETETPAYAAKVMLWSELETLKPLCNSTEITLK